jgi:hypothetical protein
MKNFLVVLFLFIYFPCTGQTPSAMINNKGVRNAGVSAKNPWLGGQIGYKFGGSGEFADNLLTSARLMYPIDIGTKNFQLPVMGNFSQLRDNLSDKLSIDEKNEARLQDLLTSTQGLNIGLYPYYAFPEKTYFSFNIHGCFVYKLNSFKDVSSNPVYMNQGRFSIGFEANIGKINIDKGQYPFTISIAPTLTTFSKNDYMAVFGSTKSNIGSLEITSILPIGRGVGVLFEAVLSNASTFRTGLLFTSQLIKD